MLLRGWDPTRDVEEAYAIYSDPLVMRYLGREPKPMASLAAQREALERITSGVIERGDGTGGWAAVLKETGAVVGMGLFKRLPDANGVSTDDFEVGWHLGQPWWGKGLATEIGFGMLEHGFRAFPELEKIYAIAYPENVASIRVMQKIGMREIGLTSKYYGMEVMAYEAARP